MHRKQSFAHIRHVTRRRLPVERALPIQPIGQRAARNILEHQHGVVVGFQPAKDLDEIGVADADQQLGLIPQCVQEIPALLRRGARPDHLERDLALEYVQVLGQPDLAEASRAQQPHDAIPRHHRHGRFPRIRRPRWWDRAPDGSAGEEVVQQPAIQREPFPILLPSRRFVRLAANLQLDAQQVVQHLGPM